MRIAYLSSAYLAPVEYYTKLLEYDKIYVEQHDHYIKQTYRNRCTIAGPDGELALSIPTVKPDTLKCPMKDIRIPITVTGAICIGMLSNQPTTALLTLNIIKTTSDLSMRRNTSFSRFQRRNLPAGL